MLTVGQLARRCGVSRTALLYYEKLGLIRPSTRGANGYRYYGEDAVERLSRLCAYRRFGLPLTDIRALLSGETPDEDVLQRHFMRLEEEIQALRRQQSAIIQLRGERDAPGHPPIDKSRWVAIMRAAGLGDADMRRWHAEFERLEPAGHAAFLRSLGCEPPEVEQIRDWSRLQD